MARKPSLIEPANIVGLALADLRIVSALLRKTKSDIHSLDITGLAGFRRVAATDATGASTDTYCGVIDSALARIPSLTNRGYHIERTAASLLPMGLTS